MILSSEVEPLVLSERVALSNNLKDFSLPYKAERVYIIESTKYGRAEKGDLMDTFTALYSTLTPC